MHSFHRYTNNVGRRTRSGSSHPTIYVAGSFAFFIHDGKVANGISALPNVRCTARMCSYTHTHTHALLYYRFFLRNFVEKRVDDSVMRWLFAPRYTFNVAHGRQATKNVIRARISSYNIYHTRTLSLSLISAYQTKKQWVDWKAFTVYGYEQIL